MQFTLVLTASKARKQRAVSYADDDLSGSQTPEPNDPEEPEKKGTLMEF